MPAKKKSSGRVTPKGTRATPPKAERAQPEHPAFERAHSTKPPRFDNHSAPRSGHRGNR
jgi:hypothetical protein